MFLLGTAVLLSYWFSHLADRYRIPSVVLLIITGIVARTITHYYQNSVKLPPQLLPILGTSGLILIVLEGTLDLRLQPGRRSFLLRTFSAASLGVAATTLAIAVLMNIMFNLSWLAALLVAAPFGVISSAVAIPSAETLEAEDREFVIYESSWSDILGVMLFNALLVAFYGGGVTFTLLGGGLAVLLVGSVVALAFYWLVGHLEGHVKFLPLLFALILVYAGADAFQLSPLLIVLVLGLTLNNSHILRQFPVLDRLHSNHYEAELGRLKHLTAEATFLVRTFFFLLLGYVTDLRTFANPRAWTFAIMIVVVILAARWIALRISNKGRVFPLQWIAPRGLITATLFFSTPAGVLPQELPSGTLILVVLISCIVMTFGLQLSRR